MMIDSDPEIRNALSSPILTFDAVDVVPISEWRFLYDESVCTAPFASVPDPLVSMIKECDVSSYSLAADVGGDGDDNDNDNDGVRTIALSAQTSEGPVDLEISSNPEVAQIFVGGYSRVETGEHILTAGKKPVEGCSSDDRQDPLVPWHIDCITGAFQVNWSAVIVLGAVPVAVLGVLYILMHRKR